VTTWTRRTAPSSIDWIETITLKKESNNFHTGFRGINKGMVPLKKANNFYTLFGVVEGSGLYLLGKTVDNFVEAIVR
jgi:hypothetical protein